MSVEKATALLGLRPGASAAAIRAAYRRRVLEVHPDRNGGVLGEGVDLHLLRRARDVLIEDDVTRSWDV